MGRMSAGVAAALIAASAAAAGISQASGGIGVASLFFLAKSPEGRYAVGAVFRGAPVTREVKRGSGQRSEYLRWPGEPTVDIPLPPEHWAK